MMTWVLSTQALTLFHEEDKFAPQYMRVFDQASHSICSIYTCNHEVVVSMILPHLLFFVISPRLLGPVVALPPAVDSCDDHIECWTLHRPGPPQELPWLDEFILTFASVDRNKHCHVCFLNQNIRGLKLYKFTFYLIGYS